MWCSTTPSIYPVCCTVGSLRHQHRGTISNSETCANCMWPPSHFFFFLPWLVEPIPPLSFPLTYSPLATLQYSQTIWRCCERIGDTELNHQSEVSKRCCRFCCEFVSHATHWLLKNFVDIIIIRLWEINGVPESLYYLNLTCPCKQQPLTAVSITLGHGVKVEAVPLQARASWPDNVRSQSLNGYMSFISASNPPDRANANFHCHWSSPTAEVLRSFAECVCLQIKISVA